MKIPGAFEAMENLAAWASRKRWESDFAEGICAHLAPPCLDVEIEISDLADIIGEDHAMNIHSWAFEDIATDRIGPKARNLVDDYLNQRGHREPISARDYLRALRDSIPSLYEVVAVKPGGVLVLRDVIRGGQPFEVHDEMCSTTTTQWDRLALRIIEVGRGQRCLSTSILQFPEGAAQTMMRILLGSADEAKRALGETVSIIDEEESFIEETLAKRPIDLRGTGRLFAWVWLSYTLGQIAQPLPTLVNSAGDEVVFTIVRYKIGDNPRLHDEISRRLDVAPALVREQGRLAWSWTEPLAEDDEIDLSRGLPLLERHQSGGLLLGSLEIVEGSLTLNVNSAARAESGRIMLKEILGGLIGKSVIETKSVAALLTEDADEPESIEPDDDAMSPEKTEAIRGALDEHYRKVVDEKVPMLGNHSPRELAASAETGAVVVEWLKFLENAEAHRARQTGSFPYDFAWMWRELGLEDLRR